MKKEQLYPESNFRMTDQTLEQFTRQFISAQAVPEATFAWQGGEPTLMGLKFFKKALRYQQIYRPADKVIHNVLQTNGTFLTDSWCQFFKEHNFLIGVSLDGPEKMHNTYRVDKGNRGTFHQVMKAIELLKKHQVEFNILSTVHATNALHPLEVYRFLRDEVEAQYLQFIPIVERQNKSGYQEGFQVTKRSVTGKQYGDFLIAIFDEWIRRDVGRVYVQIFDSALSAWLGKHPGLCIFEPTCGLALALEFNGDLYACDHFVEPKFELGNIHHTELKELIALPQQEEFGQAKLLHLPKYCMGCQVRFICNGGCPKNRIRKTPDGENGLNILCAGYKAFFQHIDRPMRIMANLVNDNKAAADVMNLFGKKPIS